MSALSPTRRPAIRSGPQTKVAPGGIPPFQRFLDVHREDVWRFLLASVGRDEAEDCFQETFVAALRAYPRLRRGSNLRAWVLTIAHRKALDAHRARARQALPVADVAELANGVGKNGSAAARTPTTAHSLTAATSSAFTAAARDEALWGAVAELPDRQRAAVLLRFVGDLPHREIAAAMDCSEQAARRSLHEGLKTLRRDYAPEVTTAP